MRPFRTCRTLTPPLPVRLRTVHRSPFFTQSVAVRRSLRSFLRVMIRSPTLARLRSANSACAYPTCGEQRRLVVELETGAPNQSHICAPGRTRTYDRQIRRLLLYPLSYGGLERAVSIRTASSRITVAPDLTAD